MAVPTVPKAEVSWFQPLKAQNKKLLIPTFKGSGVPVNTALPEAQQHGYWLRFKRTKPGGAVIPPAYSFYYTGTGPRAQLKFGQTLDTDNQDGANRVTWVKGPKADTSTKPKVAKRNPDKQSVMPLRFAQGDGPSQGFRIDPITSQQTRGRQMMPQRNAPRSQSEQPQARQQRARSRSAPARSTPKQHLIPKRTLLKGKTISQVFGKRTPAGANVGSVDTEKTGFADPRLMALMRHTPGTQELLLGGHLSHQLQPEGVQLTFTYTITIKRDSKDFDKVTEALNTVVDQIYDPPQKEKKQPAEKKDKPKPKPKDKAKEKKEKPQPKKEEEKPAEGQTISWAESPDAGFESTF